MSDLFGAIADTLASIVSSPVVAVAGRLLFVVAFVLWITAAWWAWRDAARRSDEPMLRYVATAGIVLATPVFFAFVVVVYLLLRPPLRAGTDRALEVRLAALARDRGERCPACDASVLPGWRRCPACAAALTVPCPSCGRDTRPDWRLCAWCAAELGDTGDDAGRASGAPRPVAIPIVPGGPRVPVMAVPEPSTAPPRANPARHRPDMETPHDPGGDRTVRRVVRDRPRHRRDRGGSFDS